MVIFFTFSFEEAILTSYFSFFFIFHFFLFDQISLVPHPQTKMLLTFKSKPQTYSVALYKETKIFYLTPKRVERFNLSSQIAKQYGCVIERVIMAQRITLKKGGLKRLKVFTNNYFSVYLSDQ